MRRLRCVLLSCENQRIVYALDLEHVKAAFTSGQVTYRDQPVKFRTVEVGRVVVTTGRLAATDPFVDQEAQPFTQKVPNGKHAVSLAIARFKSRDERVAFARVQFTDEPTVQWTMALCKGQDSAKLKQDQFFGYDVDSGNGAFMDPRAGKLLAQKMDKDDDYWDWMVEEQRKTYAATRSWLDCRPYRKYPENVICFSTGWGDGTYPSFFGFSADGKPSELVTDCLLLQTGNS